MVKDEVGAVLQELRGVVEQRGGAAARDLAPLLGAALGRHKRATGALGALQGLLGALVARAGQAEELGFLRQPLQGLLAGQQAEGQQQSREHVLVYVHALVQHLAPEAQQAQEVLPELAQVRWLWSLTGVLCMEQRSINNDRCDA